MRLMQTTIHSFCTADVITLRLPPAQYIELTQISPNRPEHECPHQGFHLALHNFGNSHKSNHMDQGNINRHRPIDRSRAVVVLYHRGNVFDHLNREIHGDIMKMLLRNMIKDSSMGTPITTVNKRIMVPTARASSKATRSRCVVLAGMRAPLNHVTKKGWCSYPPGTRH